MRIFHLIFHSIVFLCLTIQAFNPFVNNLVQNKAQGLNKQMRAPPIQEPNLHQKIEELEESDLYLTEEDFQPTSSIASVNKFKHAKNFAPTQQSTKSETENSQSQQNFNINDIMNTASGPRKKEEEQQGDGQVFIYLESENNFYQVEGPVEGIENYYKYDQVKRIFEKYVFPKQINVGDRESIMDREMPANINLYIIDDETNDYILIDEYREDIDEYYYYDFYSDTMKVYEWKVSVEESIEDMIEEDLFEKNLAFDDFKIFAYDENTGKFYEIDNISTEIKTYYFYDQNTKNLKVYIISDDEDDEEADNTCSPTQEQIEEFQCEIDKISRESEDQEEEDQISTEEEDERKSNNPNQISSRIQQRNNMNSNSINPNQNQQQNKDIQQAGRRERKQNKHAIEDDEDEQHEEHQQRSMPPMPPDQSSMRNVKLIKQEEQVIAEQEAQSTFEQIQQRIAESAINNDEQEVAEAIYDISKEEEDQPYIPELLEEYLEETEQTEIEEEPEEESEDIEIQTEKEEEEELDEESETEEIVDETKEEQEQKEEGNVQEINEEKEEEDDVEEEKETDEEVEVEIASEEEQDEEEEVVVEQEEEDEEELKEVEEDEDEKEEEVQKEEKEKEEQEEEEQSEVEQEVKEEEDEDEEETIIFYIYDKDTSSFIQVNEDDKDKSTLYVYDKEADRYYFYQSSEKSELEEKNEALTEEEEQVSESEQTLDAEEKNEIQVASEEGNEGSSSEKDEEQVKEEEVDQEDQKEKLKLYALDSETDTFYYVSDPDPQNEFYYTYNNETQKFYLYLPQEEEESIELYSLNEQTNQFDLVEKPELNENTYYYYNSSNERYYIYIPEQQQEQTQLQCLLKEPIEKSEDEEYNLHLYVHDDSNNQFYYVTEITDPHQTFYTFNKETKLFEIYSQKQVKDKEEVDDKNNESELQELQKSINQQIDKLEKNLNQNDKLLTVEKEIAEELNEQEKELIKQAAFLHDSQYVTSLEQFQLSYVQQTIEQAVHLLMSAKDLKCNEFSKEEGLLAKAYSLLKQIKKSLNSQATLSKYKNEEYKQILSQIQENTVLQQEAEDIIGEDVKCLNKERDLIEQAESLLTKAVNNVIDQNQVTTLLKIQQQTEDISNKIEDAQFCEVKVIEKEEIKEEEPKQCASKQISFDQQQEESRFSSHKLENREAPSQISNKISNDRQETEKNIVEEKDLYIYDEPTDSFYSINGPIQGNNIYFTLNQITGEFEQISTLNIEFNQYQQNFGYGDDDERSIGTDNLKLYYYDEDTESYYLADQEDFDKFDQLYSYNKEQKKYVEYYQKHEAPQNKSKQNKQLHYQQQQEEYKIQYYQQKEENEEDIDKQQEEQRKIEQEQKQMLMNKIKQSQQQQQEFEPKLESLSKDVIEQYLEKEQNQFEFHSDFDSYEEIQKLHSAEKLMNSQEMISEEEESNLISSQLEQEENFLKKFEDEQEEQIEQEEFLEQVKLLELSYLALQDHQRSIEEKQKSNSNKQLAESYSFVLKQVKDLLAKEEELLEQQEKLLKQSSLLERQEELINEQQELLIEGQEFMDSEEFLKQEYDLLQDEQDLISQQKSLMSEEKEFIGNSENLLDSQEILMGGGESQNKQLEVLTQSAIIIDDVDLFVFDEETKRYYYFDEVPLQGETYFVKNEKGEFEKYAPSSQSIEEGYYYFDQNTGKFKKIDNVIQVDQKSEKANTDTTAVYIYDQSQNSKLIENQSQSDDNEEEREFCEDIPKAELKYYEEVPIF